MEKPIFQFTAHGTIRLFVPKDYKHYKFIEQGYFSAFNFMSVWGNADKNDDNVISWEFPRCLEGFFKRKFGPSDMLDTFDLSF